MTWESQRSIFNHDTLKNHFLPLLVRLLRACQGHTEDSAHILWMRRQLTKEWNGLALEAANIIERSRAELSPQRYFASPPLFKIAALDQDWMLHLIETKWAVFRAVDERILNARTSLEQATTGCQSLARTLNGIDVEARTIPALTAEVLSSVSEFHSACTKLAAALSSLNSCEILSEFLEIP